MNADEVTKALPIIKQVSEIGLGILGNMTVIGIAIYFVVYLTKILKQLTMAVEGIVRANKASTLLLNVISGHLQAHDQRAHDIQCTVGSVHDKMQNVATKADVINLTMITNRGR